MAILGWISVTVLFAIVSVGSVLWANRPEDRQTFGQFLQWLAKHETQS